MKTNTMMRRFLLLILLLLPFAVLAQQDPVEGEWFNEDKTAKIQIYKAQSGKFYGKIIWLKEPNRDGKPKLDDRNPDAGKRKQPIIGLVILKGLVKDGHVYEDGSIYDPKNGKTYSCKMTHKGNKLDIRGYVGISMLGRTTEWTRAN